MELMRHWILSVTVSAMIIALAEGLMPPGSVKRAAKLTGGLVLMLGILQPLVRMDFDELFVLANSTAQVSVMSAAEQTNSANEFLKTIIEEELRAYVLDKAQSFGASCELNIHCELGENNMPYPARASISGLSDEEMKRKMRLLLREDLGIAYEAQTYIDEEAP